MLGAFFAGLALGSTVIGRRTASRAGLVRLYAALEIAIGAWALLFPWLLRVADRIYLDLYPRVSDSAIALTLVRALLAGALIVIPAACMGGTLPALGRHFVATDRHVSARLGALYAVNTLGGAIGAIAAGFYLIRTLGVDGTNYAAAALNLGVGAVAWLLAFREPAGHDGGELPRARAPARAARREPAPPGRPRLAGFAVLAFALSGFVALGYEVVWTRYLSLFLVNSIYTYSAVLAVFLLGLVAGSLLFAHWFDRAQRLVALFGYLQLAIGVSALLLFGALLDAPALIGRYVSNPTLFQFAVAAALMLVPTTLMGAVFPLAARLAVAEMERVGRSVGHLYAANTVGAIFGSLLAVSFLIPSVGVQWSMRLLAAVNLVLGTAALALEPEPQRWPRLLVAAATGAVALGTVLTAAPLPEGRLRQVVGRAEEVLAVKEGLVNTAWVTEDRWGRRALWTDLSVMGRTSRSFRREVSAQRVQGHIPVLLHGGVPRRVLGIGFGTGQTFGAQLSHPIERLDIVDISDTVVALALEHFSAHQSGLGQDPRARVIIDDGRHFVSRAGETYDVITLEMPPQEEAGVVHFYTRDFYRQLEARLARGGVVAQWLPIYNVTPVETRGIVRTFVAVFPRTALWYNSTNLLLLGFKDDLSLDVGDIEARLRARAVSRDLDVSYVDVPSSSLNRLEPFLAGFLLGPRALTELARGGSLFTDDRPELEFTWRDFPVRGPARKDVLVLENSRLIATHLEDVGPYLRGRVDPGLGERVRRIRELYVSQLFALAHDNLGSHALALARPEQALFHYREALRAQPHFAQAHNNLGSLYLRVGRSGEALEAYREAVRLAPDYAEAHYNLGIAHGRLGRAAEALAAYREALRIYPRFEAARRAIAQLDGASPR